jgi:hypothetical protein
VVLSKRERYIAIITVSAVGLLALDRFILDPLLKDTRDLEVKIHSAQAQLDDASNLFDLKRRAANRWREMTVGGLARDESAAESQILHNLNDWSREVGLSLSWKRDRTEKEGEFYKITYRAQGAGNMSQIGRFLFRVKAATVPVRISDLQVTSRKEGTDDLAVTLGVSTIYLPPEQEKSSRTATAMLPRRELP